MPQTQTESYEEAYELYVIDSLLTQVQTLETLVLYNSQDVALPQFSTVERVNGRDVPLAFLINSLKPSYFSKLESELGCLTGKRGLWLPTFCPHLTSAILNVGVTTNDAKFLSDHAEACRGLPNLKELAIKIYFFHDELDRIEEPGGECPGSQS